MTASAGLMVERSPKLRDSLASSWPRALAMVCIEYNFLPPGAYEELRNAMAPPRLRQQALAKPQARRSDTRER